MSSLQQLNNKPTKSLFFLWLLANIASWLIIWVQSLLIRPVIANFDFSGVLSFGLLLLFVTLMSFGQWLLLRNWLPHFSSLWIVVTIIGFGIGGYLSTWTILLDLYIVSAPNGPILEWDPLFGGAIICITIGLCQALILWPRTHLAYWWVLATAVAWSLSLFLSQFISYFTHLSLTIQTQEFLQYDFEGLTMGVITGLALWWLIPNCQPKSTVISVNSKL
jgi:hypothetical protein